MEAGGMPAPNPARRDRGPTMTQLLALSGSLRADSSNTALLATLAELAPTGVTVTLHPIGDLPLYPI